MRSATRVKGVPAPTQLRPKGLPRSEISFFFLRVFFFFDGFFGFGWAFCFMQLFVSKALMLWHANVPQSLECAKVSHTDMAKVCGDFVSCIYSNLKTEIWNQSATCRRKRFYWFLFVCVFPLYIVHKRRRQRRSTEFVNTSNNLCCSNCSAFSFWDAWAHVRVLNGISQRLTDALQQLQWGGPRD